jgi:hypothetical protein
MDESRAVPFGGAAVCEVVSPEFVVRWSLRATAVATAFRFTV